MLQRSIPPIKIAVALFLSFIYPVLAQINNKPTSSNYTGNKIYSPDGSKVVRAGDALEIKWTNKTGYPIDIDIVIPDDLRAYSGAHPIASHYFNEGFFLWDIEDFPLIESGPGYKIKISYDDDPEHWAFSEPFLFDATPPDGAVPPAWMSTLWSVLSEGPKTSTYHNGPEPTCYWIIGDPPVIECETYTTTLTPPGPTSTPGDRKRTTTSVSLVETSVSKPVLSTATITKSPTTVTIQPQETRSEGPKTVDGNSATTLRPGFLVVQTMILSTVILIVAGGF